MRPRRGRDRRLLERSDAKPVALAADIIKDASARGDVVLAAFAGSGAVLLAAEETGRRAAVVDSDSHRIDTGVRRWQALTGKQAVCVCSGATFAEREAAMNARGADTSGSANNEGARS